MYGRGAIVVEIHPRTPVVPVGAVVLTNKQAHAFVVEGGGDVVRRRAITLGVDGVVEGAAGSQGLGEAARVQVRHLGDVPTERPHPLSARAHRTAWRCGSCARAGSG